MMLSPLLSFFSLGVRCHAVISSSRKGSIVKVSAIQENASILFLMIAIFYRFR